MQASGCRLQGLELQVYDFEFRISELGCRVCSGSEFSSWGAGFTLHARGVVSQHLVRRNRACVTLVLGGVRAPRGAPLDQGSEDRIQRSEVGKGVGRTSSAFRGGVRGEGKG